MKKTVKITRGMIEEMVTKTVQHVLKEYNGSDAIEDYENGLGDLENGYDGSDDPAGIADSDRQHMTGTFTSFCQEHGFKDGEDALDFVEDFFTELGMEDIIDDSMTEIVMRMKEVNDLYDQEISSHI